MKSFIEVNINNLEEGMILAENITKDENIILTKGKRLNKNLIIKIKDILICGSVQVYCDEIATNKNSALMSSKITEHIRVNQVLDKMAELLKDKIEDLLGEKKFYLDELSEFHKIIYSELENSAEDIIKRIIINGSESDCIYKHSVNVAVLGAILGKWLDFSGEEINNIIYAGVLSNFGKLKIDKDIISKKSRLTEKEYDVIKTYPSVGYKFLKENSDIDNDILNIVLTHHEREDGSGYPLGTQGNSISKFSKIVAIADVFDAINSSRNYKEKKPPFEALQIIKNESKEKLDERYCTVFLSHMINFYLGEYAILSNDEKCKIIQMNIDSLEKPLVYIEERQEFIDLSLQNDIYIKELLF